MGVDIHLKICKYNEEDNFYHELALYRKEKEEYKKCSFFEGRNYELFEILSGEGDSKFPFIPIALNSLEENLRKEIEDDKKWGYGFSEVSFSDISNYLHNHPTIVDYDSDEWENWEAGISPKPQKENPVCWFFKDMLSYTEIAEGWSFGLEPYSRYKLLYWFDH